MRPVLTCLSLGFALLVSSPAPAQVPDQELKAEEVASGFLFPLGVTYGPGDPTRLFVAQQDGRIRVIKDGSLLPTPFLDIRPRVAAFGSSGLLGLVFHPDYGNNGYFYVAYTDLAGDTVIARYTRGLVPNEADPNSELILLQFPQPAQIHNGGGMDFGPDGYLYVAQGDGGVQGDPLGNAQNLGVLLGKILRLDVDNPDPGLNYGVPLSNPFVNTPGARGEIWATGVRNPWRLAIDQLTGDLWIGDVNERGFEEVDFQPGTSTGGENYGWNLLEGSECYSGPPGCSTAGLTMPFFEYPHVYIGQTPRCAVIGGLVYRGRQMATLQGRYFLGDQCSNEVITLGQQAGSLTGVKIYFKLPSVNGQDCSNVSWGEDHDGEIYAICHKTGTIYRMVPSGMRLILPDLQAGFSAQIRVTGAAANAQVFLAYSQQGTGSLFIPALNISMDLASPKLATSGNANASGVWNLNATIPVGFLGRTIWLQAVRSGAKSNVVEEVID